MQVTLFAGGEIDMANQMRGTALSGSAEPVVHGADAARAWVLILVSDAMLNSQAALPAALTMIRPFFASELRSLLDPFGPLLFAHRPHPSLAVTFREVIGLPPMEMQARDAFVEAWHHLELALQDSAAVAPFAVDEVESGAVVVGLLYGALEECRHQLYSCAARARSGQEVCTPERAEFRTWLAAVVERLGPGAAAGQVARSDGSVDAASVAAALKRVGDAARVVVEARAAGGYLTGWWPPVQSSPHGAPICLSLMQKYLSTFQGDEPIPRSDCRQVLGVDPRRLRELLGPGCWKVSRASLMADLGLARILPATPPTTTHIIDSCRLDLHAGRSPLLPPVGADIEGECHFVVSVKAGGEYAVPWPVLDAVAQVYGYRSFGGFGHAVHLHQAAAFQGVPLATRLVGTCWRKVHQ